MTLVFWVFSPIFIIFTQLNPIFSWNLPIKSSNHLSKHNFTTFREFKSGFKGLYLCSMSFTVKVGFTPLFQRPTMSPVFEIYGFALLIIQSLFLDELKPNSPTHNGFSSNPH